MTDHRVHTFQRADLEMADLLGIEARALCGVWVDLGDAGEVGDGDDHGTSDNGCMRCAVSVRKLIQKTGIHHG